MGFARFDDNSPGSERSLVLTGARDVVAARELDGVLDAVRDVEKAVAGGMWAAGFVAYEAAPAFDDALSVRRRPIDGPFSGLPLVWFGLFDDARGRSIRAPSRPSRRPHRLHLVGIDHRDAVSGSGRGDP